MFIMQACNARASVKQETVQQVFEQRPQQGAGEPEAQGERPMEQVGVIRNDQNHHADQGRVNGEIRVVRNSTQAHRKHSEKCIRASNSQRL
jgi:hypothetical protein